MAEKREKVPGITIKELKKFLDTLPKEFDEYPIMNGEYGKVDDKNYYRIDKPIIFLNIDEDTEELCILYQAEDEINKISLGESDETVETDETDDKEPTT